MGENDSTGTTRRDTVVDTFAADLTAPPTNVLTYGVVTTETTSTSRTAGDDVERYDVWADGVLVGGAHPLATALETMLVDVNRRAIDQSHARLVFHAGAVDVGGVVILPAASGSGKRHVAVTDIGVAAAQPAPLAAIVFPTYDPDGPTRLEPLSAEDALVELVPCTFAATWEVDGSLGSVVAMVESVPAYRLVFTDLAEAAALVRRTVSVAEGAT